MIHRARPRSDILSFPDLSHETIMECPACGSEEYEHAATCNKCGEYIGESQAEFGLCPDCEIKAEKRFNETLSAFTPSPTSWPT